MDLKSFVIELTGDGSPTLRLRTSTTEKKPESMHHSGGAAAETQYIYTEPLKKTLSVLKNKNLSVGVVGLGLGYIELSILQAMTTELDITVDLTSFEKDQELVANLEQWMKGSKNETYDLICEKLKIDKEKILASLQIIHWVRNAELNLQTQSASKFNFAAYDAFSQFTDGPLWTEEFLDFFLTNLCAEDCVFTTYACTGLLKQALVRNNFIFIKRLGFNGKRDATLALRGSFKSHQHLFQNA